MVFHFVSLFFSRMMCNKPIKVECIVSVYINWKILCNKASFSSLAIESLVCSCVILSSRMTSSPKLHGEPVRLTKQIKWELLQNRDPHCAGRHRHKCRPCYRMLLDASCLHTSLCRQASTKLWISPCSQLLPYRVQVKTFFCFFLHIPLESFLDEVLHQFSMRVGQARHSLLQLSQDCQVFALHLAVSCLQAGTL